MATDSLIQSSTHSPPQVPRETTCETMTADGNDTPRNLGGAPTDYSPSFCQEAMELCERGATDEELAQAFDVSTRTIYRWKNAHPEFCQAISVGKEAADARVERSLYQMATGSYVKQQQAVKVKTGQFEEKIEIVEVETYMAPEVPAAVFWLKNRRADKWRDKSDVNMHVTAQEKALEELE